MTTPVYADSLVISNRIELMGGEPQGTPSTDPRCTGAVFLLDRGYDLGEPQPVTSIVGSLAVDGERPIGRRASNRTLVLPISIIAPDRDTLVAAREVLLNMVDQQQFTITWVRTGASPVFIDCYRAQPSKVDYDNVSEQELVATLTLTIPASPYLRSSDPQPLAFAGTQAGRSAAPPAPLLLDDYSVVTGTNWSAVATGTPTGSAAHWANPNASLVNATYVKTFSPVKNLKGMTSLSHWIGTASVPVAVPVAIPFVPVTPAPLPRDLGDLHVHYVITDSNGKNTQIGAAWFKEPGAKLTAPTWTLVSTQLKQKNLGGFDYSRVASISATVTNYAYTSTRVIDVFLDDLRAAPSSVSRTTPGAHGLAYTLSGVLGTARAPINLVTARTFVPVGVGPVYPAAFSDGFLSIPCNAAFDGKAQSGSILNLAGSSLFASIAQVPTGGGTTQAQFQSRYDASNYIGYTVGGDGNLVCNLHQTSIASVDHLTGIPASQYKYWRVREGAPTGAGVVQMGWVNFHGTRAFIGTKQAGMPSSTYGPMSSGSTDGDAILVLILTNGTGAITVTDSNLNPYTQVTIEGTSDGQNMYWFKSPSAMGVSPTTDTIQINCAASTQDFAVSAYTAAGYFDVDVFNGNFIATTGTSPTVATGIMGLSAEMEIVAFMSGSHPAQNTTLTPAGWSQATPSATTVYPGFPALYGHTYWKKATSTASDTVTSAYATACSWAAVALTLKPRLNAGTVYWDVSNDGVSWKTLFSNAHSFGTKLQFMRAYFNAGYSGAELNPPAFLISGVGSVL